MLRHAINDQESIIPNHGVSINESVRQFIQQKQLQIIGSMIPQTALPQTNTKHRLKEGAAHQQNKSHSHVRFHSLKLIDYPSDRPTKTVPLQFNSHIGNTMHPLQQKLAERNNIKQKSVVYEMARTEREMPVRGLEKMGSKKKMPFFEDIDQQFNLFAPKNQPMQDEYLRVCYQKLALQCLLSTLAHQSISLTRQASRR